MPSPSATSKPAKVGAALVPELNRAEVVPSAFPISMSIGPFEKMSPKASEAEAPRFGIPNGFVSGAANAGAVALPVLVQTSTRPSAYEIARSRSPSSPKSTKSGVGRAPRLPLQNGFVCAAANSGAPDEPVFTK